MSKFKSPRKEVKQAVGKQSIWIIAFWVLFIVWIIAINLKLREIGVMNHSLGLSLVLLCSFLFACGGGSSEYSERSENNPDKQNCTNSSPALVNDLVFTKGDGSNGPLALESNETMVIDTGIYNFSSIVTDAGSNIILIDNYEDETGVIELNSSGICTFNGDIDLSNYAGVLSIDCDGQITISGEVSANTISLISGIDEVLLATDTDIEEFLELQAGLDALENITLEESASFELVIPESENTDNDKCSN